MNEPKMIVLRPYAFGETADAMVFGAARVGADCGHESWIDPNSKALVARLKLVTVCANCMPDGPVDVRVFPGMDDALAAVIGTSMSDQMIAAAKDVGRRGDLKAYLQGLRETGED